MADVHRRIELQEQEDLQYLIDNVRRAAHDKLNLVLPPIEGEDALRTRVEELVQEFIQTLIRNAAPNVLINGHAPTPGLLSSLLSSSSGTNPASTSTKESQVFEPISSKLVSRAQDLAAQEAALVLELGDLKRAAPGMIAEKQREAYVADIEENEKLLKESRDAASAVAVGGIQAGEKLERQETTEEAWNKAVEELGKQTSGMGTTAARMGEAKKAGGYALAER